MKKLNKPTLIEKASGNVAVQSVLTGIAAITGNPIPALLPILSNSLASGRYKKRVEKALEDINEILIKHEKILKNITDAQYKIINEIILTILQTTEQEKILYLKNAIKNGIHIDISMTMASQLSRIIRDISSEEIVFLNKNINYEKVIFVEDPNMDSILHIEPNSHESILAACLMSMGLLVPSTAIIDNIGSYTFSELSKKLLEIVSA